jgi:predicted O-methyltransferase YrrM
VGAAGCGAAGCGAAGWGAAGRGAAGRGAGAREACVPASRRQLGSTPDHPAARARPSTRRRREEAAIASAHQASLQYAEAYVPEDAVLTDARAKAAELGCVPIGPGVGAALRMLAAILDARAVVELGTGTGVSGVWLLRGMNPTGVLTTIDVEPEHQRAARETFAAEGVPPNRTRLISGRALEVVPRLTDGHYDLVLLDADRQELAHYLEEAVRLLRPGGVLAVDNALWHDRVADPAQRDPETVAIREFGRTLRVDDRLVTCLLPVGDGLLCAVKRRT